MPWLLAFCGGGKFFACNAIVLAQFVDGLNFRNGREKIENILVQDFFRFKFPKVFS
jgi:hypothetical protein